MKLSFVVLFSLFAIRCYLFPNGILAQAKIPLVVAPARQTVAMDAGTTESLLIKFFNESSSPISGNIKAVDFVVTEDNGAPVLLEDQENDWVKFPYNKATIAAGDVLRLNFKINIPSNTLPGGRYIAIIFEPVGQIPEASNIKEEASIVSTRIVGLVNVRINGPVYDLAFLNVFKAPKFVEFGPIPVYFEILNKGGYHITPVGQLKLTNWFGKEIYKETLDTKNIFPEAKRNYSFKVGNKWMFGKYLLEMDTSYGEQGKVLTARQSIWVVPVTLIVIIILAIIAVFMLLALIIKKLKSKQVKLEEKLEEEISELETLKSKFKDRVSK